MLIILPCFELHIVSAGQVLLFAYRSVRVSCCETMRFASPPCIFFFDRMDKVSSEIMGLVGCFLNNDDEVARLNYCNLTHCEPEK